MVIMISFIVEFVYDVSILKTIFILFWSKFEEKKVHKEVFFYPHSSDNETFTSKHIHSADSDMKISLLGRKTWNNKVTMYASLFLISYPKLLLSYQLMIMPGYHYFLNFHIQGYNPCRENHFVILVMKSVYYYFNKKLTE